MIKPTIFQDACMQSAPASAYLNSGSITTGGQLALLLKSRKSNFVLKQFLLHKCYKRSFWLPCSSGHDCYLSYLYLLFLKISSNRSLKSRNACLILPLWQQLAELEALVAKGKPHSPLPAAWMLKVVKLHRPAACAQRTQGYNCSDACARVSHFMYSIHRHHWMLQTKEIKHQGTVSKLEFPPEGLCSSVIPAITALCRSHFPQPTLPVAPAAFLATDSNSGHWLLFKSTKGTLPVTSTWHDSNTIFKIQIFNRKI